MQITAPSLFDRAIACWDNGRIGRSQEGLVEARAILAEAEKAGDGQAMAAANRAIGWFCLQLGYSEQGIVAANAARSYYADLNDDWGYALSLAVYSWLVLEIGLSDISFETASEAVTAAARTQDYALNAFAINCKGIALIMCDEDLVAEALLNDALALAKKSGDPSTIALTLVNLGYMGFKHFYDALDVGNPAKQKLALEFANRMTDQAIRTARECGDLWNLRVALANSVEGLAHSGRLDDAFALLDEFDALPGVPGPRSEGHYHFARGNVLERVGRDDEAINSFMTAEALARTSAVHDQLVQVYKRLSEVNAKVGNFQLGLKYHQNYHHAYVRQVNEQVRQRSAVVEMQLQTEALRKRAEELELQVGMDPLTNVPNRRAFTNAFEQLSHHQMVVAILDIDYFKHVNDVHSHAVGDVVLMRVAQAINEIDPAMSIYRIGGEEFAALFPAMSLETAEPLAWRAVEAVRQLDFSDVASKLKVTISVGLVEAGVLAGSALLAEADRRLYVAKKNGRNQVIADNRASTLSIPAE